MQNPGWSLDLKKKKSYQCSNWENVNMVYRLVDGNVSMLVSCFSCVSSLYYGYIRS